MALSDPQSTDPGGGAVSLPRTSTKGNESVYTSADSLLKETFSVAKAKRKRTVLRVDKNKITADPFKPADNVEVSMSCYIVFDKPLVGFTNKEAAELYAGLVAQLAASSSKVLNQVLGDET